MKKNTLNNVVAFPTVQPLIHTIRSRDSVLSVLLPKFFGVLWTRGKPCDHFKGVEALVGHNLEISAFEIVPGGYCLSAYLLLPNDRADKVFSAHVASRAVIDGVRPYWDGRCCILSWKRGEWEDRLVAEQVDSRTVAHLLHAGLISIH
jgi:hypothetical protein